MSSDSDYDSDDSENDSMCGADDNLNEEVTGGRSLGVEASGRGTYQGRGLKWKIGQKIYVKFMDGSSSNQDKVEKIAKTWEKYANITFKFVTKGYSDIRITFDTDRWSSKIGTYALNVSKSEPTMRLGIKRRTKPETLKRHVLHEFGHALGLLHEHQSPASRIVWDEKKVYAKYNYWSREKVRSNVLNKGRSTNYTRFDPKSIMLYNVDKRLTKNRRGIKRSNTLSSTDKEFIGEMYPFSESDSESDSDSD